MSGGSSRAFYQFSRDVYSSISSPLLFTSRYISRALSDETKRTFESSWRKKKRRNRSRYMNVGRSGRRSLNFFLRRVIPKRANSAETEDTIPRSCHVPAAGRAREGRARACVHLGRQLQRSWTILGVDSTPSSVVFFATFGTSCTERSVGEEGWNQ